MSGYIWGTGLRTGLNPAALACCPSIFSKESLLWFDFKIRPVTDRDWLGGMHWWYIVSLIKRIGKRVSRVIRGRSGPWFNIESKIKIYVGVNGDNFLEFWNSLLQIGCFAGSMVSDDTTLLPFLLLKIISVRMLHMIVCSGPSVWLFSPAWDAVVLTLDV